MSKSRKVKPVKPYYGTSGLVSANQIVDATGDHVFYPDNSSGSSTRVKIIVRPKQ